MIMPIKVSQLMAISLLLLVGCSGKSDNTNDSNLPGSSSNIPNDQSPSANIPTDQPAPDQNPTDSVIVGRWQERYNATAPISGNYQIITTVEFYSDGTYEYSAINTSDPGLNLQSSGRWTRSSNNNISANIQDPNSGKIYEHRYRIIDQNTIMDHYGGTSVRLP